MLSPEDILRIANSPETKKYIFGCKELEAFHQDYKKSAQPAHSFSPWYVVIHPSLKLEVPQFRVLSRWAPGMFAPLAYDVPAKKLNPSRIPVREITLTLHEGPFHLVGKPRSSSSWKDANCILSLWTRFAEGASYLKAGYEIWFENGFKLSGRYDLYRDTYADLQNLVKHQLEFNAGLVRPKTVTDQQWNLFQKRTENKKQLIIDLLATLDL